MADAADILRERAQLIAHAVRKISGRPSLALVGLRLARRPEGGNVSGRGSLDPVQPSS